MEKIISFNTKLLDSQLGEVPVSEAYGQLSDSFNWKHLNTNGEITNKMLSVMKNGTIIPVGNLQTFVSQYKNRFKSPISNKVLDALVENEITIMKSDEKMPTYLPFFLIKEGPHSVRGIVIINNFLDGGGGGGDIETTSVSELFVDVRKFKVVLEACLIAKYIQEHPESPKLTSTTIIRSGSKIHATIFTECLNRKHSIKLDPNIYNSILYLDSKFFIKNCLGANIKDEEVLNNYCLYNCKNADYRYIKHIDEYFEDSDFVDIAAFIKKLATIPEFKGRLGNLNVSAFLTSYINMYDSSMLLGLETFTYLIYNIISVNEGTFLNNYISLKNLVGDDGRRLYADLVSTII